MTALRNDDLRSITVEASNVNGDWYVVVRDGSDTSAMLGSSGEREALAAAAALRVLLAQFRDRVIAATKAERFRNVLMKIQEQIEEVL